MRHIAAPSCLGGVVRGAIFDLDGVLVDTAACHHRAWRELGRTFGLEVTPELNERLKGVSRERSLDLLLGAAGIVLPPDERRRLADRKNARYVDLVSRLDGTDLLPSARHLLETLRARGIRLAIRFASRNARLVIDRLGIRPLVDVVVDGDTVTTPKPDPEVFLVAATRLGLEPGECVVFEDAEAGLQAARAGGMAAVGVGQAVLLPSANLVIGSLAELDVDSLFPLAGVLEA